MVHLLPIEKHPQDVTDKQHRRYSQISTRLCHRVCLGLYVCVGAVLCSLSGAGWAEEAGILFQQESSDTAAPAVTKPLVVPQPADLPASPPSQKMLPGEDPALLLADVAGGKTQFLTLSQQVLNQLVRQQPELARHEKTVLAWGREALTWDKMRVELAHTYHQYFTAAEIKEMVAFFSSTAGQKWLKYNPLLKEQTIAIGQRMAKSEQPKLMLMLQEKNLHAVGK